MKECSVCSSCFADNLDYCPADGVLLKHSLRCDLVLDERYRLERRLGRGGMGVVFKASHVFLRSTHAVKVILPHLVGEDPMLVTRFRQEAVVAASIRHKNIVSVTDFGVADDTMPFLVMEFLVGKSLGEILHEKRRLSAQASLEVMEAIGAGVSAAHRRGIVHRDLKPLNIFVQEGMPISEGLKILDFGLAKIKATDLYSSLIQAKTTNLMGSPLYMAPEQWSEGEPDARADVYSIGIILYQMLAGDTPFTGSTMPKIMKGHLMSEPPAFASIGVKVSRHVEAVVRHALQKDPHHRPSSVEELIVELRQAVGKKDSVADPLMFSLQLSERETAPLPRVISEELTREFGSAVSAEPLSVDDHILIETQRQIEEEADRLMRELEDAQRRAEDARKRVEEAARKRAEKEAERKRAEEAAARKRAEEAQALKRAQEEEQKRVEAEQARKRAEEEESQRLAAEEAQRAVEQENARKLAEEEANRLAMEVAEARSRAEDARQRADEEAKGRAQEEAARRDAEERAARLAQELEEIQQRAEEARKRAEEQELRRADEDAERRRAEEESERKRAEEEVRRRQEEQIARQTAEAEAARLAAEVKEAQQRVEEARIRAEEEAQRRLEEEAARKRAEEEAIRLVHEVDEVKHRADEVRRRAEEEAIRLGREIDEAKQRADEIRKLADEKARKEAAQEFERKLREEQQKRESAIAAHDLNGEITILQGSSPSQTAAQRAAQTARDTARETFPVIVESYQRRSFSKWMVSVIVVVLLGLGGYAAYWLTRPAPAQPAEPPAIRPDLVSIPAGTFLMGRDDGSPLERPSHSVTVKAFSIDRTEVTNAEYAEFVRATNHAPPSYWLGTKPPAHHEKLPVVSVSYEDAQAFAEWRSNRDDVTYRVPTEEQWEYAAKGVNGYLYPWGQTWLDDYANVKSDSVKPVGSYPKGASSWGALDMIGNVMEWTSSRASIYPGNKEKKIDAEKRDWIVVRGSSYMARDLLDMTTTMRQSLPASNKHPFVGFRLIRVDF